VNEILRSAGEAYSEFVPLTIAAAAAPLFLIGYCVLRWRDSVKGDERRIFYTGGIILALIFLTQMHVSVKSAESDCERQFREAGGTYGVLQDVPFEYKGSRCANVWPNGPKAGNTGVLVP
jgi:hypothetical protein